MKLLVFSDLHEDEAALDSLRAIAPDFDHVLICGDISHSVSFAEDVLSAFPGAFIVPGNWDSEKADKFFASCPQWVHGRRVELADGINVVGFGYSAPTPFGTFGELSEEKIRSGLSGLQIDSNSLLMLHSPPKGHFDEGLLGRHIGSESILAAIKSRKPLAAFFGHAHEHEGTAKLGPTTLVKLPAANSMRACSVSLEGKKLDVEFLSL